MRKKTYTTRFKRNLKLLKRRNYDLSLLVDLIDKVAADVDPRTLYKNHPLHGDWVGHEECHVTSVTDDWLLVYQKRGADKLVLAATGDHQMIFGE